MCAWKIKRRQTLLTMQRYIAASVQRRDSSISTNRGMVGDAAGVLLSVFFELLLEVVDEDGEAVCSLRGRSNNRGGLVAGWPKLAKGENKSGDTDKFESKWGLAMATPQESFPFL
jgi:hypothetical protein